MIAFYTDRCHDRRRTALQRSTPELMFYVAGADPYEGDRLGRLALSIEGLRERDSRVADLAASLGVPLVATMAGGYCADVDVIARIHANTLREAAGRIAGLKPCATPNQTSR
jgi:acetoin utilization deacetylase AcuC-like enzyme